jgi:hypothetical protein
MGIINFLIVLAFNLYWLKDGWERFSWMYNGTLSKWLTAFVWFYAAWGILNLVYGISKL